jgi:hypothetical protein
MEAAFKKHRKEIESLARRQYLMASASRTVPFFCASNAIDRVRVGPKGARGATRRFRAVQLLLVALFLRHGGWID